jgi:hypothetical protein
MKFILQTNTGQFPKYRRQTRATLVTKKVEGNNTRRITIEEDVEVENVGCLDDLIEVLRFNADISQYGTEIELFDEGAEITGKITFKDIRDD